MLKSYVRDIKKHSQCAICGDTRWYVLDFHHLSDKESNISEKVRTGCSLETLKKEIEKCICVCANCHREIHYKELVKEGKI